MALTSGITITELVGTRDRVIYVGVPTFGTVSIQWHLSQLSLQHPMNRQVRHAVVQGAEVAGARNRIVQEALDFLGDAGERVSHVFFIDDDVLVPPQALVTLLQEDRDIVSGLYYAKTPDPQPLVLAEKFGGTVSEWVPGETVDCYAHGMGCTLIKRQVFEAMSEAGLAPKDTDGIGQWFNTTKDAASQSKAGTPIYYNQTEDVYFLERAAECGFQPAVATRVFCWHWDLKGRTAYPQAQWREFTQTGKVTFTTKAGSVVWPAGLYPGAAPKPAEAVA